MFACSLGDLQTANRPLPETRWQNLIPMTTNIAPSRSKAVPAIVPVVEQQSAGRKKSMGSEINE